MGNLSTGKITLFPLKDNRLARDKITGQARNKKSSTFADISLVSERAAGFLQTYGWSGFLLFFEPCNDSGLTVAVNAEIPSLCQP